MSQRYNLYRESDTLDSENKGELILSNFTVDNLYSSTVPSELYDLTIRCIKYIEETIGANGVEVVYKKVNYLIEKSQ